MDLNERRLYVPRLRIHWQCFKKRFELEDPHGAVERNIFKQYGGTGRHYHSLKHITNLLDILGHIRTQMPEWFTVESEDLAIEFALWEHDVFYIVGRADNEEMSARVAHTHGKSLGLSENVIERAMLFIRATDHKALHEDVGAQIVCDIDLSSLAAPWNEFCLNTLDIHREFSHFSAQEFLTSTSAFFKKTFLDLQIRPHIYQTLYFRDLLEEKARANLRRFVSENKR